MRMTNFDDDWMMLTGSESRRRRNVKLTGSAGDDIVEEVSVSFYE